jgi:hypothetical protein
MAKRTINRRELREQSEAAEKRGLTAGADKKKAKEPKKKAAAKPKRSKAKVVVRKRLVWVVYSGSLKEEGRFPYAEREQAETRAEELMQKHKRTFFVQALKEPIADKEPAAQAAG